MNQKIGDKNYFVLPQGIRQDGETLKQVRTYSAFFYNR